MDKLAVQAAEDFVHAGYPVDAAAILLCELDGSEIEVATHTDAVRELLNNSGATEGRTAKDAQQSKHWQ
jgi:glycolate oxidase